MYEIVESLFKNVKAPDSAGLQQKSMPTLSWDPLKLAIGITAE